LQYTELVDGVWFPEGGMYRMIESLEAIAKGLGARFHYDAPVARIDVEGQRAAGVTLESGESVRADVVLANADLPYVYGHLLPDDGTAERLRDKRYTSSTIMFYWGLRGEKTPEIFHHNVFLADHRYRESFEQIFEDLELPDEPSFYIHAPSRTLPEFAPEDGDGLMVLVPTGHMRDNGGEQDWPALQARAKESVLRRLAHMGLTGLEERIVFEETLTPADYKEIWNLEKGAAFGLSHNVMQVGYLRPHNRHRRYRNLYFAGASTHPGTGLPIVLLSAKLATERILEEQGR
jgi:phytoene desaturase